MDAKTIFAFLVIVFVSLAIIIALSLVRNVLAKASTGGASWSLGDALAEEANIAYFDASNVPVKDTAGNIATVSLLRASSSRTIAFVGLIVILMMYVGFGLILLRDFATTDSVPSSTTDVLRFLAGGATLFIPYVANKASSIFDWLQPAK